MKINQANIAQFNKWITLKRVNSKDKLGYSLHVEDSKISSAMSNSATYNFLCSVNDLINYMFILDKQDSDNFIKLHNYIINTTAHYIVDLDKLFNYLNIDIQVRCKKEKDKYLPGQYEIRFNHLS